MGGIATQDDVQQRAVNLQMATIVDETQFAKFIYEEAVSPSLPIAIASGTKIYPLRLRNTLNWRIS